MSIAIRCEGIGKRYQVGEPERYQALRDTLTDALHAPYRMVRNIFQPPAAEERESPEVLWALQDVSLEVPHGEVLGIIGRNGAGKSTLLRILSRITKPTKGRAEIRGRVGTLLEVGAGFHPELSGRENIYLNGAVLGMSRGDIERRLDEIVEFSECERFLDMPLKRYSSGMYMRLAFSVAAHLETEILFVDEVLAVGDVAFQKKCLGKMGEAAHHGRTVLFVSHNLVAVDGLCTRAICLHDGKIVLDGPPKQVTSKYLLDWLPQATAVRYDDIENAPGGAVFKLRSARIWAAKNGPASPITVCTGFYVEFEYWKCIPRTSLNLTIYLYNDQGVLLFETSCFVRRDGPTGLLRSRVLIPGDLLNNGGHRIGLAVFHAGLIQAFDQENLLIFDVHDEATPERPVPPVPLLGVVRPNLKWNTEVLEEFK